ncbi:MAG: hypothetical protein RLZZ387_769 [Chloroflexota bacterium]|jgi:hypothetical protein
MNTHASVEAIPKKEALRLCLEIRAENRRR